jgi:hypothetical protein
MHGCGRDRGVRPPHAGDAGAVRPAGSWGTAIEVPGPGTLDKGGNVGGGKPTGLAPGAATAPGISTPRLTEPKRLQIRFNPRSDGLHG